MTKIIQHPTLLHRQAAWQGTKDLVIAGWATADAGAGHLQKRRGPAF